MREWFSVLNADEVPSPALLVFPDRIEENLRRMLAIAGGPARLRPHVKTHKIAELIRRQLDLGLTRFKCATLAEVDMVAASGGRDILLAFPPVGPTVPGLRSLALRHPDTFLSVVVDDTATVEALSRAWGTAPSPNAPLRPLEVLLDLDVGMHRTGIAPGDGAVALYERVAQLPGLRPGGLHAYDGHLHESDPAVRAQQAEAARAPVLDLAQRLAQRGLPVPRIVAGGTPTFPFHARHPALECSPGTCVLWDAGYAARFPDLEFLPAAVLLTRVISRPTPHRRCLDLGHKAVASEMPHPRVAFLNLPPCRPVLHSEEHLVVETEDPAALPVGTVAYALPWHVCPTVALHAEVVVVEDGRATDRWRVIARDRACRACRA